METFRTPRLPENARRKLQRNGLLAMLETQKSSLPPAARKQASLDQMLKASRRDRRYARLDDDYRIIMDTLTAYKRNGNIMAETALHALPIAAWHGKKTGKRKTTTPTALLKMVNANARANNGREADERSLRAALALIDELSREHVKRPNSFTVRRPNSVAVQRPAQRNTTLKAPRAAA